MTKSKRKRSRHNRITDLTMEALSISVQNNPGDTEDCSLNFRKHADALMWERIHSAYDILARLVVRECVRVVDETYVSEEHGKPLDKEVITARIKHHFGLGKEETHE